MTDQKKILLLTSKTGGGHISLAQALDDLLSSEYTLEMVDPQPRFFHLHYRLLSRYALWLWAAEFQLCDTPQRALLAHRVFTLLVNRALRNLVERFQPDAIISTYPFLTYEVMQVLKQMKTDIPLAMLFADPNGVHASWLTEKHAALTMAPTRETYAQALSVGFEPERVALTGWPVRAQFYRTDETKRAELLRKLGLNPDTFTLFLQGGGEGSAQFERTIHALLSIRPSLQIILAAGTKSELLKRFQGIGALSVLPFTKEIAPFMAAADVIMGKAGPNMLFESVTLCKPFIATAYIPGQEQANLEFIRRHKLGWVALEPRDQLALLKTLVTNPEALASMRSTVELYRQWNRAANETIVPSLQKLL